MSAFQRMLSLAKQEWVSLTWGTLFLLISSGLNLTYPMLIGRLIDSVKDGGGLEAVNQYAMWMIGIFVLVGFSTFLRSIYLRLLENGLLHDCNHSCSSN